MTDPGSAETNATAPYGDPSLARDYRGEPTRVTWLFAAGLVAIGLAAAALVTAIVMIISSIQNAYGGPNIGAPFVAIVALGFGALGFWLLNLSKRHRH